MENVSVILSFINLGATDFFLLVTVPMLFVAFTMYKVNVSNLTISDKVCWLVALFFFNIFATIAYWMANYRESANA